MKNSNKSFKCFALLLIGTFTLSFQPKSQIVYHDLIPDAMIDGPFWPYQLDVDNDGNFDFIFYHYGFDTTDWSATLETLDNQVLGQDPYPYSLEAGEVIDSNQTSYFIGTFVGMEGSAILNKSGDTLCDWAGVTDKYLGFRFRINSQWHYGWARLDVAADASCLIIKDYAYNSEPNQAINAEDMGSTGFANFNAHEQISLYPNPLKDHSIIDLPSGKINNVQIYNTYGQLIKQFGGLMFRFSDNIIWDGTAGNGEFVSNGVYLIKIVTCDNEFTSKIIIQK